MQVWVIQVKKNHATEYLRYQMLYQLEFVIKNVNLCKYIYIYRELTKYVESQWKFD